MHSLIAYFAHPAPQIFPRRRFGKCIACLLISLTLPPQVVPRGRLGKCIACLSFRIDLSFVLTGWPP